MKGVIERLEAVIYQPRPDQREEFGDWCFDLSKLTDSDAVRLKALLSYTKQCEEALRPFADLYLQHDKDGHPEDDRCAWGFNHVDLTWGAFRKALSLIQQGE